MQFWWWKTTQIENSIIFFYLILIFMSQSFHLFMIIYDHNLFLFSLWQFKKKKSIQELDSSFWWRRWNPNAFHLSRKNSSVLGDELCGKEFVFQSTTRCLKQFFFVLNIGSIVIGTKFINFMHFKLVTVVSVRRSSMQSYLNIWDTKSNCRFLLTFFGPVHTIKKLETIFFFWFSVEKQSSIHLCVPYYQSN